MTNQVTTMLGMACQSATRHDGTPLSSCGNVTPGNRVGQNRHL